MELKSEWGWDTYGEHILQGKRILLPVAGKLQEGRCFLDVFFEGDFWGRIPESFRGGDDNFRRWDLRGRGRLEEEFLRGLSLGKLLEREGSLLVPWIFKSGVYYWFQRYFRGIWHRGRTFDWFGRIFWEQSLRKPGSKQGSKFSFSFSSSTFIKTCCYWPLDDALFLFFIVVISSIAPACAQNWF